jgi:hypothetical protein
MGFGHCLRKLERWMANNLFWSLAIKFGNVACNMFLETFIKLCMGQVKATKIIIANE